MSVFLAVFLFSRNGPKRLYLLKTLLHDIDILRNLYKCVCKGYQKQIEKIHQFILNDSF